MNSFLDLLKRYPESKNESQSGYISSTRTARYNFTKDTVLYDSLPQKHPYTPPFSPKQRPLHSLFPDILSKKSLITECIEQNKAVAFIGKNLQEKSIAVPEFILEHAAYHNQNCLILVCKYDDMLAVEAAHRLANERGEKVGETVGYKVSNETNIKPSTCLIFCTPMVILHTLANRCSNLISGKISHKALHLF